MSTGRAGKKYSVEKDRMGKEGESLARLHLEALGYRILDVNFRFSGGEIDIIAEKDGEICFVEVRSRWLGSHGNPLETITRPKQTRVIKAAQQYINEKGLNDTAFSFGAVGIVFYPEGAPEITFIPNAFTL